MLQDIQQQQHLVYLQRHNSQHSPKVKGWNQLKMFDAYLKLYHSIKKHIKWMCSLAAGSLAAGSQDPLPVSEGATPPASSKICLIMWHWSFRLLARDSSDVFSWHKGLGGGRGYLAATVLWVNLAATILCFFRYFWGYQGFVNYFYG